MKRLLLTLCCVLLLAACKEEEEPRLSRAELQDTFWEETERTIHYYSNSGGWDYIVFVSPESGWTVLEMGPDVKTPFPSQDDYRHMTFYFGDNEEYACYKYTVDDRFDGWVYQRVNHSYESEVVDDIYFGYYHATATQMQVSMGKNPFLPNHFVYCKPVQMGMSWEEFKRQATPWEEVEALLKSETPEE